MISVIYHFAPCLNIYGEDLGQGKGGDKGGCKGREDIGLSDVIADESFLHIKANLTGAYEHYQVKKNTLKIFLKPLKCLGKFRRELFFVLLLFGRELDTGGFHLLVVTSRNQNSLVEMFDIWSNEKDSGSLSCRKALFGGR